MEYNTFAPKRLVFLVLPLPDAKKFYEKINWPEKVKLIEKFMKKKA